MTTTAEQGLIWIPALNVVLTVVFYALFPIVFPLLLFSRNTSRRSRAILRVLLPCRLSAVYVLTHAVHHGPPRCADQCGGCGQE
ncbi:MAG: hypothetical protein IPO50_12850 [Sphingomonadales bacterium]|nr:hypothetical protein [Sphingomonadales bacterium]